MLKRLIMLAGIGLALWSVQPVQADQEWDKLESEYEQAMEKWEQAMEKAKGDSKGGMMMVGPGGIPPHPIEKFRSRFRAYAEKHDGKPAALPALTNMLTSGSMMMMGGTNKSGKWALTQLKNNHAHDPKIADHLTEVRYAAMSVGETPVVDFLETVAKKNSDRNTKGRARLAMAEVLYEGSPFAMMMQGMTETDQTKAKKKRAVKMLRDIRTEFAGNELAEQADDFLYAIDNLQVGMKAPQLAGKGADGKEIRMSQFEGKVVAIVFWSTWCMPCMQMIPHERELMEKHAGKPFTILGINVDESLADCTSAIKKEKITWPTIYDGSPEVGEITRKWRVNSFPTIVMIDHEGLIRHKNVMPFQLESVVEDLVAEALKDGKEGGSDAEGKGS